MASVKKLGANRYQATVWVGLEDCKQIVRIGATEDEALLAALTAKSEIQGKAGEKEKAPVYPNGEKTVGEIIDRYIASKSAIVSPTTYDCYRMIRRNHLQDLMEMRVDQLTQEIVQNAVNNMAKHNAPKTVANAHGLLASALNLMYPQLKLHTTLPQKRKKDIYVPDADEVAKIYSWVIEFNPKMVKPYILATQCGLRASEIAGLTAECVHEGYIEVRQAKVHTTQGDKIKTPKSYSGYRQVPISENMYGILMADCVGNSVCDVRVRYLTEQWYKFRKVYNINSALNFHALRHHFASQCLIKGIPQKYIAELMGHKGVKMIEQVYQHTFPSAMSEYGNKMREQSSNFLSENSSPVHKLLQPPYNV